MRRRRPMLLTAFGIALIIAYFFIAGPIGGPSGDGEGTPDQRTPRPPPPEADVVNGGTASNAAETKPTVAGRLVGPEGKPGFQRQPCRAKTELGAECAATTETQGVLGTKGEQIEVPAARVAISEARVQVRLVAFLKTQLEDDLSQRFARAGTDLDLAEKSRAKQAAAALKQGLGT